MLRKLDSLARSIRIESLRMVTAARASHIGGALSMADLLAVLYGQILNIDPDDPRNEDRDRFILSKGHSTVGLYATLALRGFFPVEELQTYGQNDSRLLAHVSHNVPGVEFSTGSLGHGLPFAVGKAFAAKRQGKPWKVVALLSDGELDEGSNWEAILFAAQHNLDNLFIMIDFNKIQSLGSVEEVIRLEPLDDKMQSFGCNVFRIDGHDYSEIIRAFTQPRIGKPNVVIADTVKGKGVDFMENKLLWHYKSPSEAQLSEAIAQLEAAK